MSFVCLQCEKSFYSAEALEQHRKAVHGAIVAEKNNSTGTTTIEGKYIFYTVIVLIVLGLGYWIVTSFLGPGTYDDFAKCLTEKGATFYGAFWCSHCKEQKALFGKSARYLNYVECSTPDGKAQLSICKAAGIEGYPTWIFADGTRSNIMTLRELSDKTSCSLP